MNHTPTSNGRVPAPSNTYVPTRTSTDKHTQPITPARTCSEHWLQGGLGVDWGRSWAALRAKLDRAHQSAFDSHGPVECELFPGEYLQPEMLAESRRHWKTACPWCLRHGQYLELELADDRRAGEHIANVFFTVRGRGCTLRPGRLWWATVRDFIAKLGGTILWDKPSRIDICADLSGQSIEPFRAACDEKRYVWRGRDEPEVTTGNGTRMRFQTNDWIVRIYDKRAQLHHSGNPGDLADMIARRWGGTEPKDAVRVEIQLRRKALRGHGIGTFDAYFAKRAAVAVHFLTDHVRLTAGPVDRDSRNQPRAALLPEWQVVQDGFAAWDETVEADLSPCPSQPVGKVRMEKRALGDMLSVADMELLDWETDPDVLDPIYERVKQHLKTAKRRPAVQRQGGLPPIAAL